MSGRSTTLTYGRARVAVLAAGAGWVGYFFYYFLHLIYPIFLL